MLHAPLIGARRLVSDLGHYGLMAGPVRRALIEPAASISDDALRLLLAYYGRRLGAAVLNAGPCGNLSARCRDGPSVLITTSRREQVAEGAGLVILERHGAVSVGATRAAAADRMEFGELSARTVLLATGATPCA